VLIPCLTLDSADPTDVRVLFAVVVDVLDTNSRLRLALRPGLGMLEELDGEASEILPELRRLERDGRIELLAGCPHRPALTLVEREDAVAMLKAGVERCSRMALSPPAWTWLDGVDLSSELPVIARQGGLDRVVVSGRGVELGMCRSLPFGSFETTGASITVLASDPELDELAARGRWSELGARIEERKVGTALRFEALGVEDARTLHALLQVLEKTSTELPSLGEGRCLPFGRVWSAAQSLPAQLADAPEWDRFHKRLLSAGRRVREMHLAADEALWAQSPDADARAADAQECTGRFHSLAGAASLGHAPVSHRDPTHRGQAWRQLLALEARAHPRPDEGASWDEDEDCDGLPELHFDGPWLRGTLTPAQGGSITGLEMVQLNIPLVNGWSRRLLPHHRAMRGLALKEAGEAEVVDGELPPETMIDWLGGGEQVTPPSFARDRILGPGSTLEGFARGGLHEIGDFSDNVYERIQASDWGRGQFPLAVGRSGTVDLGNRRALVRIEKIFLLSTQRRRLRTLVTLANRSREPVSLHYGLHLSLHPGLSGPAGSLWLPALEDPPVDLNQPRAVSAVDCAFWDCPDANLVLRFSLNVPCDLWAVPRYQAAGPPWSVLYQGMDFLLHRPVRLWGGESFLLELQMDLLPRDEVP
jgi:hypothetical protein